MSTDLKFFTNEPDASLLERFRKTLENNTQFFDALVGYFRSSGFFQLYRSLEDVEKVRVLVGLNVDKVTHQVVKQVKNGQQELLVSTKEAKDGFEEQVQDEVENADDKKEVEEGIRKFIEFIKTGKLEIRIYPDHPIHAKVYIVRKKEGYEDFGKVITGSSNFSQSGLVDNLEFNVELKDKPDVEYALNKFEELWKKGIDVSDKYVETVNKKTWLNDEITPYDLYLKFLYEYFREKINYDKEMFADLPRGFLDLEYQKEAVADALLKIREHNGVFLSDVVGLGKTYISALLAKKLGGQSLVICPPVLKEYWEDTLREFGVVAKVESHGKLDEILSKGVDQYNQVFIDEAHRFRNEITQGFEVLHQICAGKKVILVSATPLNNRPADIACQMYLFQKKNNSTIPNLKNLKWFFDSLEKKLNSKLSKDEYIAVVRENSKEIREVILKYVMVRRTRAEVEKFYKEDLQNQGVTFPKVQEPTKLFYAFDDQLDTLFTDTLNVIKKIRYARYEPIKYLKTQLINEETQIQKVSQENVRGFMKGLLVKRLESSFYAFGKTLDRFVASYDRFIEMFDSGTVYVSKKVDVYDLLDNDQVDELLKEVEDNNVIKYEASQFREDYKELLIADREYLEELRRLWSKVSEDPKFEKFLSQLSHDDVLKDEKVLIFTESRETGEYLNDELSKAFPNQVLFASGKSSGSEIQKVRANFDPKYTKGKGNLRILVTTDVLSEGINLHEANVIVNYDIPWNSVRIMQRVGRVNRVGTKHDQVFIYNFFPTSQSEKEIGLEKLAVAKIQAFHDTLGEDSKYLTGEEEFSSWELFSQLNSTKILHDEDKDVESELEYLRQIRQIRDEKPEVFEKLKKLPAKARTARVFTPSTKGLLTFFRRGSLKKFYKASDSDSVEIDFFTIARELKVNENEKKLNIPTNFYDMLSSNKQSFDESLREDVDIEVEKRGAGSEKTLMKTIKALMELNKLTEDDEAYLNTLMELLEEGAISKKSVNETVNEIKGVNDYLKIYSIIRLNISENYLLNLNRPEGNKRSERKEVILSEAFV